MANDLSNPVQAKLASDDGFFEHGAEQDSLFSTVQLAQNGTSANGTATPAAPGQTIHVTPPQGEAGPVVIRVEVTPGSIVELPQPFEADAALMAKEGDGNLAIKVGDVTVILQGYVDANQEAPVTIEGADNQPIDIATILASTDPTIDIQTAAGPDAGQNGQGADNSGAILAQLEDGNGLGGFEGVGGQDGTELGYRTIDASIRNDFADQLVTADVFGFSVGGRSGVLGESSLRDPAQTQPFTNNSGTFFGDFLEGYRDAVEHPGQAMFAGWADFHGTAVTQNNDFDEYLSQTTQITTVNVNFTGATGDLVLTGLGNQITSNGSHVSVEITDGGHTMFLRRDESTAGDKGNALIAVVHVDGPDADGNFTIETFLVNRIDHPDAGKDTMDLDIQFTVYDGPAPQGPIEGGEGNDLPQQETPNSPSIEGHVTASFDDDVPILEQVTYHNQHDGSMAARSEAKESVGGSTHGLIDEDWTRGGAHDTGADGKTNAGADGDTGGGKCVTGSIQVNFGADGAANADGATEQKLDPNKHAFVLDTATYVLGQAFPYGQNGLNSGGQTLVVLSVSGDHLTVGIADQKLQTFVEGKEGDTSDPQPTDPIPGCTVFTLTLNQATGQFEFDLKGPLDHPSDAFFGDQTGVSALVATDPENTIPLEFGVKAYDDDGDWVQAEIDIDVNDDVPVARSDKDTVAEGSHDAIKGNVMDGTGTDSGNAGKDSQGADHAQVVGVWAGSSSSGENDKVSQSIDGQYGKLTLNADGSYIYTRNAYSDGGVDDVFTYTLKDGDGDKSSATLTIHIDDAGVTVDLPTSPADTTVYEAGLPDGSNAAADSEHTAGTITITAKDGIETLEIAGDTLTLAQLKDLGTTHHEISDSDGKLTLTGFDEATGKLTYTYDLTDNNSANSVKTVEFDIKVTDVDGDTGTAKLAIDIVDDQPTANCDTINVNETKAPTADVQFVLDISGSMKDQYTNVPGNYYPDNRIGLERYAVEQMLTKHPEIQNVQIVLFDDHASHSEWMTRDEALAWIKVGSNFNGQGGNTNFDEALKEAMEGFVEARPLAHGDQTLVYFFSDGKPNEPRDEGITNVGDNDPNNVSVKEWTDFVNAHDISNVFGVGIPGIASHLAPIAYPDGAGNSEPNQIGLAGGSDIQLGGLLGTLTDAIVPVVTPITGNVTTNDVPGADGFGDGKLTQVSYNGNDYTFDSTTHEYTIDLGTGRGTLLIKDDGSYKYTPPAKDADGNAFFVQYTMQDGDGDTAQALLKIDINTRPVTDLNGAGQGADNTAHFVEDNGAIKIAPSGTISDDGVLLHSMTVTLTNRPDGDGTEGLSLNAAAQDAADIYGITWTYGNGVLSLSRTDGAPVSAYQFILQNIVYNNSSQAPNETDRHITVVVNDGTLDSVSHEIDVCVTAVNDAPTADIRINYNAVEQTDLALSGKIGSTFNMLIGDVDSGNDTMTVTLHVGEGKLTVSEGNSGADVWSGNGTNTVVIKGSVTEINNLLGGIDTGPGSAGSIKYYNGSDTPSASTTLTLTVNDNGNNGAGPNGTATDSATIYIQNTNDKPDCDPNGPGQVGDCEVDFYEQTPVLVAPSGSVTDDGNLVSMTVILTSRPDGNAVESLSLNAAADAARSSAGLTVSYNAANGTLTINGTATPAVYQTILQGVLYNNPSDTPNTAERHVTVVVNDGSMSSTIQTIDIDVHPINDAPTANIAPATFSAVEDIDLNLSGQVSGTFNMLIGDVDAANDTVSVTLSVTEGKITVSEGNSGAYVWSGNGTSTVVIKGSVTQINNLLKETDTGAGSAGTIKYKNDNNTPSSSVQLTLTVNDQGENGSGGAKSASDTATITVQNTNDKPETDLNGGTSGQNNSASFTEDQPAVQIAPNATVSDDSGKLSSMTVSLSSRPDGSAETLSLNAAAETARTTNGLSISNVNGVITISGATVDASVFQTILRGIVYNNSSQAPDESNRTVTVTVKDAANLVSDSHSVTVAVNAVNDAPVASLATSTFAASEGTALILSGKGLSISDVDSENDQMTVTLTVGEGKLNVSAGNSGVDSISGSGGSTVTIKGSVAEINNLLKGTDTGGGSAGSIEYLNASDTPSASTTLTFKVSDQGHNGDGGALTDTELATITIAAVNDAPCAFDDNVYTNAGKSGFQIAEWALLYNDSDVDTAHNKLDLVNEASGGVTAISDVSSKDTAVHTNGTDAGGYVTYTDTGGNNGGFDYKMHDGSGESASAEVTIHNVSGSSVTGSSGDDIVIGGSGDDTLNGGSGGTDLIFGGAGDDTMIFGGGDKYDGGTGFDQVRVTTGDTNFSFDKGSFLGVEMVDVGETNDRGSSDENTFSLNAGDLVAGATGTSLGGHSIALYVIGDSSGGGRDNVDLTGFGANAIATNLSFKDNVTDVTHVFNIYEAAGGVKVAVEAGLDVH